MDRKFIAKLIYISFTAFALIIMWQAVRFCQGDIGTFGIGELIEHVLEIDEGPWPWRVSDSCVVLPKGMDDIAPESE